MNAYVDVKDKRVAVIGIEPTGKPVQVRQSINNILIIDRSGSMWHNIGKLISDVKGLVDRMAVGDTLSVGWFSSERGQFAFPILCKTIGTDNVEIKHLLDTLNSTVSTTCFSEILMFTKDSAIQAIKAVNGYPIRLTFMTDGYPVVSNTQKEVATTLDAMKGLSQLVSASLIVGYGDWYNKELMAQMAKTIGGVLVHSSHIDEFMNSLNEFTGGEVTPRVPLHIPAVAPDHVWSIVGGLVVEHPLDGTTALVPEGIDEVYFCADADSIANLSGFNKTDVNKTQDILYSLAYLKLSYGSADEAIDFLGALGDVYFIDKTINAQTNAEYGAIANEVMAAISNSNLRFQRGRNTNYVPADDAYCLVDLFNELSEDSDAFFYPRHKLFNYKRIGVPSIPVEGSLEFTERYGEMTACPFGDMVWNSTRLNLSVRALIPGTVDLGPEAEAYGLPQIYGTQIFRNYTIVKDGVLNVTSLPVSVSYTTFLALQFNRLIPSHLQWDEGGIYSLDLTVLPMVNRKMATPPTAVEYCKWLDRELSHELALKYLNEQLRRADPTGNLQAADNLTDEQRAFLESKGIKKGSFSPKTTKGAASDRYVARAFDVKIAGFSSLPKVEDVENLIKSNATLKPYSANEAMAMVIKVYSPLVNRLSGQALVNHLVDMIKDEKTSLKIVRSQIQSTRFAVLLAKKWFTDLKDRDGAVVELDGKKFTFVIKEVEEEL